ncbi:colicin I receptor [Enterobacter asburiae]|nr:colicin I receptor [Enterobacter asburiae]
MVSPDSAAITGRVRDIADAQSPPLTKGFNLNIPYLHEVNTTKSNHHCSQRLPFRPHLRWVGDTLIFDNDKANDNYYQLNC